MKCPRPGHGYSLQTLLEASASTAAVGAEQTLLPAGHDLLQVTIGHGQVTGQVTGQRAVTGQPQCQPITGRRYGQVTAAN